MERIACEDVCAATTAGKEGGGCVQWVGGGGGPYGGGTWVVPGIPGWIEVPSGGLNVHRPPRGQN